MRISATQFHIFGTNNRVADVELKNAQRASQNQNTSLLNKTTLAPEEFFKAYNGSHLTVDAKNNFSGLERLNYNHIMSATGQLSTKYNIQDKDGKVVVSNETAQLFEAAEKSGTGVAYFVTYADPYTAEIMNSEANAKLAQANLDGLNQRYGAILSMIGSVDNMSKEARIKYNSEMISLNNEVDKANAAVDNAYKAASAEPTKTTKARTNYNSNLYNMMKKDGFSAVEQQKLDNPQYLQSQLQSGIWSIGQRNSAGEYVPVSLNTVAMISDSVVDSPASQVNTVVSSNVQSSFNIFG